MSSLGRFIWLFVGSMAIGCGGSDEISDISSSADASSDVMDGSVGDVNGGDAIHTDGSVSDGAADSSTQDSGAAGSSQDSGAGGSAQDSGAAGSSQDSGTGGSVQDSGLPDASPPPQCPTVASCPGAPPSSYDPSDGLRAINPCAFPMKDTNTWTSLAGIVDKIAKTAPITSVGTVLSHLNRTGQPVSVSALTGGHQPYIPGFKWAFGWNSGDQNVAYWIPQGLTGSTDATAGGTLSGKRLAVTTWYYNKSKDPNYAGEKGIRISLADITNPAHVAYRLMLLVQPYMDGARPNFKAIDIHAGGAAWVGRYLYVADTTHGLRVFDTRRILRVATSKNMMGYDAATKAYYAFKYAYVVPQVGYYRQESKCSPRFSFVALDRSSSPPVLVSGEYSSSKITGRLFRWPVDLKTGRLSTGTFFPSEAYYLGKRQVQGAVSHNGKTYLSSSQPPSGRGDMTGTTPGKRLFTDAWVNGPEDLVFDTTRGQLWGASESTGHRYVFAVDASKL